MFWKDLHPGTRWTLVTIFIAFVVANVGILAAAVFADDTRLITIAAWGLPAVVIGASMAVLIYRTRE